MNSHNLPLYILLIQLFSALVCFLFKRFSRNYLKIFIVCSLFVTLFFSFKMLFQVFPDNHFVYNIGDSDVFWGIEFLVTPLAASIILLIAFLSTLILPYSFGSLSGEFEDKETGLYYAQIFLMIFAMFAVLLSNDLFNLYLFMEILFFTSCSIVSIKPHTQNLVATARFLIGGAVASASVLTGIAFIYKVTGTLNLSLNYELIQSAWETNPKSIMFAMLFLFVGLGMKAAVFPLHSWLPELYFVAPTSSSTYLSGQVVKVYLITALRLAFEVFGLKILLSFSFPVLVGYIGMLAIIFGSLFAIGQTDIESMLAFSSVSQIGYILLGLSFASAEGIAVSLFHVVTHALLKTALALSIGSIIYKTGKRNISDLKEIGCKMPISMIVFSVAVLGMVGIPGTNGFMSKWHICLTALKAGRPLAIAVILISSFLNLFYYLPVLVNAFLCTDKQCDHAPVLDDLPFTMIFTMLLLAALCIFFGLFPQVLLDIFTPISLKIIG